MLEEAEKGNSEEDIEKNKQKSVLTTIKNLEKDVEDELKQTVETIVDKKMKKSDWRKNAKN